MTKMTRCHGELNYGDVSDSDDEKLDSQSNLMMV